MNETVIVGAAVVVGAMLTWLVVRARRTAAAAAERERLQARVAALEALEAEMRRLLVQRDGEVAHLHDALAGERELRGQADARWEASRANLEEQRRLLEEARSRLTETFKVLSAEALEQSGAAFLERAREALDAQLGRRQDAVEGLVRPLQDALGRYEGAIRAMEGTRAQAYGSLEQQLRALATGHADLQRETGALVAALRTPHVRGRWGELTLHRVVELAGLTQHCDYLEQVTVEGQSGRVRPDMIVRLPAGREIVVDAKVPLSAYLDALAARTEEERTAALARHAQQMRQHMSALASKAYWDEFAKAADLVVMFIPGESFVAAAAEADGSLIEDGLSRRVVVATPTTLIALLRSIAYGWRQEQLAQNAGEISALGRQLYERLRVLTTHVGEVGASLGRATAAFNRAVGSMESRVLPSARRFRDLGAAGGEDLPLLEPIDERPRELSPMGGPAPADREDITAIESSSGGASARVV
jgi:DNA recombination protein RmuC